MSPEMPQSPESASLLPDLMPKEHFANEFYYKLAQAYWNEVSDPDKAYLFDFVLEVAHQLTPQELLDLATTIENDFPDVTSRCDMHTEVVWNSTPTNLTVDESGDVHGRIGNVHEVIEFLEEHFGSDNNDTSDIDLMLRDAIVAAAFSYGGEDYARELDNILHDEEERRDRLPRPESPNIDQLDMALD